MRYENNDGNNNKSVTSNKLKVISKEKKMWKEKKNFFWWKDINLLIECDVLNHISAIKDNV